MEKRVVMRCGLCGSDQFSIVDEAIDDLLNAPDETTVKCSDCGRIISKKQLIEENEYIIAANMEDFKEESMEELRRHIKRVFR